MNFFVPLYGSREYHLHIREYPQTDVLETSILILENSMEKPQKSCREKSALKEIFFRQKSSIFRFFETRKMQKWGFLKNRRCRHLFSPVEPFFLRRKTRFTGFCTKFSEISENGKMQKWGFLKIFFCHFFCQKI